MATLVVGLGLTACSVDTSGLDDIEKDLKEKVDESMQEAKDKAEAEAPTSTVMYQCPDDCENGPAYMKAGDCKKCGKEMVEI